MDRTKTNELVMTALMICLITVSTMFFKIPIPFANGYVHLGDAMVFMSVLILGVRHGILAAAIGSALGDVLGGFAIWAPWTLVIKAVMALIMGLFIIAMMKSGAKRHMKLGGVPVIQIIGMALAGAWMVFGYYIAEGVLYGWAVALIGIPWNIGQFVTGMVIASALAAALSKTPARRYFVYSDSSSSSICS